MDMAHTAQWVLMWGRDDGDRAACGQMDIKNYHDSMSRSEMWRCQLRREIPRAWSSAAIRLQRCPEVRLSVRSGETNLIARTRGAITGNSLAPWFGQIIVEDAFIVAAPQTNGMNLSLMGIVIRPMAWSDNILAFGVSAQVL